MVKRVPGTGIELSRIHASLASRSRASCVCASSTERFPSRSTEMTAIRLRQPDGPAGLADGLQEARLRARLLRELGVDALLERAAEVGEGGVGDDAVEAERRIGVERRLLGLDDVLVLHEALHQRVVEREGDGRVVQVVVVEIVPEEVRRAARLGSKELAVPIFLRAFAIALLDARAGGGRER